ncbi:MAG: DUF1080 domain-containing protein [Fimbriimonadaceae bacterium]
MMIQAFALFAATALPQDINTLSKAEKNEGWKLLFDGTSTKGWQNFKSDTISSGWGVKDGTFTILDPGRAGDIVTADKYEWFELQLEFNMQPGQNSGILFRVADTGEASWHSGPEIQIYESSQPGAQISGFLYELYSTKTPASKPAGEWNHFRIHIAKDKCWTEVNGVRYYEFVIDSEDFWARVKKSKFNEWPDFAKLKMGRIGIQGDHGKVAFRNIKIKTL